MMSTYWLALAAFLAGFIVGVFLFSVTPDLVIVKGKPGGTMVVGHEGVVYRLVEIKGDPQ